MKIKFIVIFHFLLRVFHLHRVLTKTTQILLKIFIYFSESNKQPPTKRSDQKGMLPQRQVYFSVVSGPKAGRVIKANTGFKGFQSVSQAKVIQNGNINSNLHKLS